MSQSMVYVLMLLFLAVTAFAAPNKTAASSCSRYFTDMHDTMCHHSKLTENGAVVNYVLPSMDKDANGSRIRKLIHVCCNESCTLEEILSYC